MNENLTANEVEGIILACLLGHAPVEGDSYVIAHSIVRNFCFSKDKIEKYAERIGWLLHQLPQQFLEETEGGGGGWSFLNACMTKNGELWGQQRDVEALLVLGVAAGWASIQLPREIWSILPGGVPYFVVHANRKEEKAERPILSEEDHELFPGSEMLEPGEVPGMKSEEKE
jgi:hypothetical protein